MAVPFRVRHFDEVGADEFIGELRFEVLQLFQGSTVPETIQSLNQALDLLEVTATTYCWHCKARSTNGLLTSVVVGPHL